MSSMPVSKPIPVPTEARIKKLPPLLVNQLAAGEIVTRPASVVKELMENAIDAGATTIVVKITQGGMGKIEVSDNGCGIHPDDMVMAVTRHATSKVANVAQLHGIQTLGFRGEALASTAAVSRLTLMSSHNDSGIGRQLTVVGVIDDAPLISPVLHKQGTTVVVKDLYFNVPARRGNLKSIATEFAHIEAVVRELALAVSHIKVSLWHDERQRFCLQAINTSTNHQTSVHLVNSLANSLTNNATKNLESHAREPKPSATLDPYPQHSVYTQQILTRLRAIFPRYAERGNVLPVEVDLSGLLSATFDADNQMQTSEFMGIRGVLLPQPTSGQTDLPKLIYIDNLPNLIQL